MTKDLLDLLAHPNTKRVAVALCALGVAGALTVGAEEGWPWAAAMGALAALTWLALLGADGEG